MSINIGDRVRITKVAEAFRVRGVLVGDLGTVVRMGRPFYHIKIDGRDSGLKSLFGAPFNGAFPMPASEYEQVQAG